MNKSSIFNEYKIKKIIYDSYIVFSYLISIYCNHSCMSYSLLAIILSFVNNNFTISYLFIIYAQSNGHKNIADWMYSLDIFNKMNND